MTDDLLSRSRYALMTGDLGQAEELCSRFNDNNPGNTAGLLLLGTIFIREGKLQSAQKAFETVLESEDDNPEAWINIALVHQKRGRLNTALNSARKAYRLSKDRGDIIFNIANIHKQLGELSKAEQIYRLSIEKEPDFIPSYNNLAILLMESGKQGEAERILLHGLDHDENHPGLHFNLANLYRKKGADEKAIAEYRTALKINPGWEECLLPLGDMLKDSEPEEAERLYQRVLDLSPSSREAETSIGEIKFLRGNPEDAEIIFTKVLAAHPDYTPAAVSLAAVLYDQKRYEEAEKLLREYQAMDPDNLELRLVLGNILLETAKYNEAFSNIRYVLDRDENEARAWFAMARQFSLSGKKDRALNTYRKGLMLAPESHQDRLQLALLLKNQDKTEAAIRECEYICAARPGDFAPSLLLAELYIENSQFSKSAGILERLLEQRKDDPSLLQMYAETAQKAGMTEKALSAAEQMAALKDQDDFNLEELNENLNFYDEMAVEYAREYGSSWSRNLKALAKSLEPDLSAHEERNFLFDGLQDIAGEYVPILDVGGIDPIIVFDEEEEELTLTDEDEFIPPEDEEDDEPEVEEVEKHEEVTSNVSQAAAPQSPLNFGGPLTIKLETPPIVIRQQELPPAEELPPELEPEPEPEPEPFPEPEPEPEEIFEEEEIIPTAEPEQEDENIFGYLDRLTGWLPPDKRKEYNSSDTRLRLAALKARLSGDPGLLTRISSSNPEPRGAGINLTTDKIGDTLNFMSGLSSQHPDPGIAESLGDKLKRILTRLNYVNEDNDD